MACRHRQGSVYINLNAFTLKGGPRVHWFSASRVERCPTKISFGGGDQAAQWRAVLTNIKSDLEELGGALDYLIRLTLFVKGSIPNSGVLISPNYRLDVMDEFFAERCLKHCSYNNPPPSEVIGVAALAQPDIVVEIVAVAALPLCLAGRDPTHVQPIV